MRRGEAPLDRWSLVHVASGGALAVLNVNWYWMLAILVGFEAVEAGLRRIKVTEGGLFEYESWWNVAGDLVTGAMGWAVVWFLVPFRFYIG
jgi:hypothetical protein